MKDNPKIFVKDTHKYGKGIFAKKDIKKGEFISSFEGGKVYFAKKASDLPNAPPKKVREHTVQFAKNKYMFKQSNTKSLANCINHSCNPNCGIKKLLRIVAMRKIKKGEELTWDYDMTENSDWKMKCKCESRNCRKIIRGYRYLPQSFRRKYKGYISEWLLKRKKDE